ncbi:MAG: ATP-binding protein [Bacteroidia bacterium]|nr:ATP-binding protein [Bacteroidia bacterium]
MIPRLLTDAIHRTLPYFPILYVGGPRQSGKTTLLRHLFAELPYASLEDPDIRRFALDDPRRFLSTYPAGVILDEVQRVPELFSYLQGLADENAARKYILSGSQNFLLMERITQSLAGRVGILTLLPFGYQEAGQDADSLETFAWRGGYPPLVDRGIPQEIFFSNYVQTYLERDVREIRQVGDLAQFHRFLLLCAGRAGQLLNMTALASDAGISPNTARDWLSVLEASWIVFRLQPYYRNFNKRLIKTPKLYFYDTGLLAYLLGVRNVGQLQTHFAYGALIENAIIAELVKQRYNQGLQPEYYFFRDANGQEVDLLLVQDGRIHAIEIKASHTAHPDMFKGLKYWQELTGTPSADSMVIYGGSLRQETKYGILQPWQGAFSENFM